MKKKVLLVFAAAMLMMCSTMTAFAAGSPVANGVIKVEDTSIVPGDECEGTECHDIKLADLVGEELALAQEIVKAENLKTVLSEADAQKTWNSFMFDAFMIDAEENEVHWSDARYHFPVQITFGVLGVTAQSNVKVLHYSEDEEKWSAEKVDSVGADTVKVTFEHLSPVVILVEKVETSGGATGTGTPSAPQTGESNIVLYAALIATAALAGAVVTKKKEN